MLTVYPGLVDVSESQRQLWGSSRFLHTKQPLSATISRLRTKSKPRFLGIRSPMDSGKKPAELSTQHTCQSLQDKGIREQSRACQQRTQIPSFLNCHFLDVDERRRENSLLETKQNKIKTQTSTEINDPGLSYFSPRATTWLFQPSKFRGKPQGQVGLARIPKPAPVSLGPVLLHPKEGSSPREGAHPIRWARALD